MQKIILLCRRNMNNYYRCSQQQKGVLLIHGVIFNSRNNVDSTPHQTKIWLIIPQARMQVWTERGGDAQRRIHCSRPWHFAEIILELENLPLVAVVEQAVECQNPVFHNKSDLMNAQALYNTDICVVVTGVAGGRACNCCTTHGCSEMPLSGIRQLGSFTSNREIRSRAPAVTFCNYNRVVSSGYYSCVGA